MIYSGLALNYDPRAVEFSQRETLKLFATAPRVSAERPIVSPGASSDLCDELPGVDSLRSAPQV